MKEWRGQFHRLHQNLVLKILEKHVCCVCTFLVRDTRQFCKQIPSSLALKKCSRYTWFLLATFFLSSCTVPSSSSSCPALSFSFSWKAHTWQCSTESCTNWWFPLLIAGLCAAWWQSSLIAGVSLIFMLSEAFSLLMQVITSSLEFSSSKDRVTFFSLFCNWNCHMNLWTGK